MATHAGEAGVAEIFRALTNRLRDSTWTIVFKSLIIVHLMIREGEPEVTLKFLAQNPHRKLAINHFTEGTSRHASAARRHQRGPLPLCTRLGLGTGPGARGATRVHLGLRRWTRTDC